MRIISGKFKGRALIMPKGAMIRPTSQKVRAALFNIIGEKVCAASVLELFAGSASIGIEAKSRGAEWVCLVENSRPCAKAIGDTLKQLKLSPEEVLLLPLDFEAALDLLQQKGQKFDLVFLDPPYRAQLLKKSLIKIDLYDILNAQSWVIAEHNRNQDLPQELARLKLIMSKKYGDSELSFYQAR